MSVVVLPFPENYKKLFIPTKTTPYKDVFENFYFWVLKQVNPSHNLLFDFRFEIPSQNLVFQISSVAIGPAESAKLKLCFFKHLKKATNNFYKDKYYEDNWIWNCFAYGPSSTFLDSKGKHRPDWLTQAPEDGYVYVNTKKLWDKK